MHLNELDKKCATAISAATKLYPLPTDIHYSKKQQLVQAL